MDADIENLTMLKKEKLDEEKCPKCNAEYPLNSIECPNCGVVFKKIKTPASDGDVDARDSEPPLMTGGHPKKRDNSVKRIIIWLLVVGIFVFGLNFIYTIYIESRIHAGNFQSQIDEFCTTKIAESHVDRAVQGNEPYRTGKVLVVAPGWSVTKYNATTGQPYTMAEPSKIHPAWFKLSRKIRAKNPDEIDTLIRIQKELRNTGRYGKVETKVFSTHKIILDVYDWRNQTFIGTKVIDPGEGSAFMTEKDYDALVQSVSDEAIADYVQSMDVYE